MRRRGAAIVTAVPSLVVAATCGLTALVTWGCAAAGPNGAAAVAPIGAASDLASTDLMRAILDSHPGLAAIAARAPEYRLQAVLGTLEPGADGRQRLVQHGFRAGAEYFYPASTVKLFAAIAALERLGEIGRETGLDVGPDTPLVFRPLFAGDQREESDPTNLDSGAITLRHEIRKLFLVSDNAAFNRLYELVGQDGLARSMGRAGLSDARIVHRLSEARTPEENRRYPRIDLVGDGFVHTLPERSSAPLAPPAPMPGLEIGSAYLGAEGERIEGPMDFAAKNRISLEELQRGLCKLVRPDVDCGPGEPYALTDADRALLLDAMSSLPRESANPVYDPVEYPDDYVKPVLPGLRRSLGDSGARGVRLFDKSGQAYGFTIENAYVADEATGRAFFLAATLYTNADGVLNDDTYDYAEVALPFFADLAEATVRWLWLDGD